MLLHQAVRGFELWFGVRPEVTPELRALVEADLGKTAEVVQPIAPEDHPAIKKAMARRSKRNKKQG
jgi:hypothetical protein